MEEKDKTYQNMIFDYVEQVKELLSPEIWQNVLLNCSKNELFVMWYLYRHQEANMTELADYIHVPLNTATGIISRMEKRNLVIRNHSAADKRVVTIALSEDGAKQIQAIMGVAMFYVRDVFDSLTLEESRLLGKILDKVTTALKKKPEEQKETKKVKRIAIE